MSERPGLAMQENARPSAVEEAVLGHLAAVDIKARRLPADGLVVATLK